MKRAACRRPIKQLSGRRRPSTRLHFSWLTINLEIMIFFQNFNFFRKRQDMMVLGVSRRLLTRRWRVRISLDHALFDINVMKNAVDNNHCTFLSQGWPDWTFPAGRWSTLSTLVDVYFTVLFITPVWVIFMDKSVHFTVLFITPVWVIFMDKSTNTWLRQYSSQFTKIQIIKLITQYFAKANKIFICLFQWLPNAA